VRTISIGTDQGEVLIPTVINGRVVSEDQAVAHYRRTGEHLGIFRTPEEATGYAQELHRQQERQYTRPQARGQSGRSGGLTIDRNNNPGALRIPGSTQFQRFASAGEGIQAQESLLRRRYLGRGLNTVQSIVETYAPRRSRGGDNTDAQVNNYISYVARRLGINPNQRLSPNDVSRLGAAMREFETGRRR
jgi:hypothetical protein